MGFCSQHPCPLVNKKVYMSLQAFVWAIRSLAFCVGIAFLALLLLLDPSSIGWYGDVLFYTVVSTLIFLCLYLLNIGTRRIISGDERTALFLGAALRQSVIITMLVFGTLFLWKQGLLYWWSMLLGAAFGLLLEFTFRSPLSKEFKSKEHR
jgi:hypothetical protein